MELQMSERELLPPAGNQVDDQVDLSLVLPCYNSALFLADSVASIDRALRLSGLRCELVFVDDGSRDGTAAVIERLVGGRTDCQFLRHKHNTGRGRAVMDGMRQARGRAIGFTDVDLATPAHYVPLLAHEVFDGADVATALRVYLLSTPIVHRWILSRGYNWLVRTYLGMDFFDSETGCKFFSREALRPLLEETQNSGWFWDTEIMVRAACRGYRIVEMPTAFVRRPELGSTVHLLRDTVDYFVHLLRFRSVVARLRAEHAARVAVGGGPQLQAAGLGEGQAPSAGGL
jgi:glycosyltransferase AglD